MTKFLVLAAAALAAAPAFAQEAPSSVKVVYGDLNLASADGAATLKARVKAAARQVCGFEPTRDLSEILAVRRCRAEAMGAAQPLMTAALSRASSGSVVVAARR